MNDVGRDPRPEDRVKVQVTGGFWTIAMTHTHFHAYTHTHKRKKYTHLGHGEDALGTRLGAIDCGQVWVWPQQRHVEHTRQPNIVLPHLYAQERLPLNKPGLAPAAAC